MGKVDNKNYWIFEKSKFIEMWDDWWKGKVDPRKANDIDAYRVLGRKVVMGRLSLVLLCFEMMLVGAVLWILASELLW